MATAISAEIVNFDSVQMHKDLNIGSAKPTLSEQHQCQHWLLDVLSYPEEMTAGRFKALALQIVEDRIKSVPLVLVGGSGFYLKALQTQMNEVAEISDEVKRAIAECEKEGGSIALHQWLTKLSSQIAQRTHVNDQYRLKRNLGLCLTHGVEKLQSSVSETPWSFGQKKLGIYWPRDELRSRAKDRIALMLKAGLIEEIEELKRNYGNRVLSWKPLQSIGYKEGGQYLREELKKEDLADAILRSTMALAKRQMTWFKRDHQIEWIEGSASEQVFLDAVRRIWRIG